MAINRKNAKAATQQYTIDAVNRPIGRLASEVAVILMGKNKPNYERYQLSSASVTIQNIAKVSISEKKLTQKVIYHHTGYPGGLKSKKWRDAFEQSPKILFLKVIKNMLPKNSFNKILLKRIRFE